MEREHDATPTTAAGFNDGVEAHDGGIPTRIRMRVVEVVVGVIRPTAPTASVYVVDVNDDDDDDDDIAGVGVDGLYGGYKNEIKATR